MSKFKRNLALIDELLKIDEEKFLHKFKENTFKHISEHNNINVFMIDKIILNMNEQVHVFLSFNNSKINTISIVRQDAFYSDGKNVYDSFKEFEEHIENIYGKPRMIGNKKYQKSWKTDSYTIRHDIIDRFGPQEQLVFSPFAFD